MRRSQGSEQQVPPNPALLLFDVEARERIVISSDILINQLRREGPKIEASFDSACAQDLRELSDLVSTSLGFIFSGLRFSAREGYELGSAAGQLLMNASNTLAAATAVLRMGYVLQPGILIRSFLEAISTVLHLLRVPQDLKAYQEHTLQSPRTIAAAKQVLPPFGLLYGYFSDNFAHIGKLHKSITRVAEFKRGDEALEVNLGFLRLATWLLYVTTELLYHKLFAEPRYWRRGDEGYLYDPSEEERMWLDGFFRLPELRREPRSE
ncbi:MAG: hypothetical protein LC667_14210 [Thioalkalivibrio sp.]|nr:hypothetical protein [Thioalkalivibrio sp.]